jgi:vanillate/3-O-methylgallate O-demethylase
MQLNEYRSRNMRWGQDIDPQKVEEINMTSLEEKIKQSKSVVEMLRNAQVGPYVFPIQAEYTNWRDEQEGWQKTAVLFDQSFHMTDSHFRGPDVYKLLEDFSVNSFKNFQPNRAKQIVCCNQDGYVIGDSILFHHAQNHVSVVGRPPVSNWLAFNAKTGGYDVEVVLDERSVSNPSQRAQYRLQIQGPAAEAIFTELNGTMPDIQFFHMGKIKLGPYSATALNHSMSRSVGLEFWGPTEEREAVIETIMKVGKDHGLKRAGSRTYSTVAIESGWIPSITPAIYTGESMKAYREYLPANGFEGNASIGGSFVSSNVEDYYATPWDLGLGFVVKFDHDFMGRTALERKAGEKHRKKVWLYWNKEDVLRVFTSMWNEGNTRFKHMEMPAAHYATLPFDAVLKEGELLGLSTYPVYTANVRGWFSLAMVGEDHAIEGNEVTLIWGEPDGGSAKPGVERHVQTEIKAMIGGKPLTNTSRKS